jgi:hypothetical protein
MGERFVQKVPNFVVVAEHSNFNDGNALEIPKATSILPNVLATPPTI